MEYNQDGTSSSLGEDKTWLGIIVGILVVVPSQIPAGIVVWIYQSGLRHYVSDNWIPYLEEVSLVIFPEMLRGVILGAASIFVTTKFVKNINIQIVRYSVLTFWAGGVVLLYVFYISKLGIDLNVFGSIFLLIGLGAGLFGMGREASQ